MRVAIIGAGIFGSTAAIYLARAGHDVHLYEKRSGLMECASAINQYRLHEGYHYPRSPETASECRAGLESFVEEYGPAVIRGGTQMYGIAAEGSLTSAKQYRAFCRAQGLPHETAMLPGCEMAIKVSEARLDPDLLWAAVEERLDNVTVHLDTPASYALRDEFDHIVIAAYASTNQAARELKTPTEPFRFEVVEKPVLQLPSFYRHTGMVIMDGPFCCIDPFGSTGLHVMGHVEHAIHHANEGLEPEIPVHLKGYLNRGIVPEPKHTKIGEFIEAGRIFFPFLERAEYAGSMYTVRAVLPGKDATDERPTLVTPLDEQVTRIFSGKIATACQAAQRVVRALASPDKPDARAQSEDRLSGSPASNNSRPSESQATSAHRQA